MIQDLLADLARERPIFHSEADFQHAFAWMLHLRVPDARILLEYRPSAAGSKMYVDTWVVLPNGAIMAIELKYKTRRLDVDFGGESYRLLNQSAQDQGRYDFLNDVCRLERLTAEHPKINGAAILLTNDSGYWTAPRAAAAVDAAFRLHEGRLLAGHLAWAANASAGTRRGREAPIGLVATYSAAWTEYSRFDMAKAGVFRYLLLDIIGGEPSVASSGGH